MTVILERRSPEGFWKQFCDWVTSPYNRFYIGWFGVLMIPSALAAATCFLIAMICAPPVVIDGLGRMVTGSLLGGNNLVTAAIIPTSPAIGLHLYPIWDAPSTEEWLLNGGPYQLIVLHFLIAVVGYLGRLWEFSYRLGLRPWIAVAFTAPASAAFAIFLVYPLGQGAFASGMPLGITGTFNWMVQLQAEHNVLNHPLHMLAVAGVFGAACLSAFDGSVVSSALERRTDEVESINYGYLPGSRERSYSLPASFGFVGRLIAAPAGMRNSRMVASVLAVWSTVGVWCGTLLVTALAFNLNGINYQPIIETRHGIPIPTWADVVQRANSGIARSMEPGTMTVAESIHRAARWIPEP